ncbi:MAG: hypothetical protein AABW71_05180 [Nanoarchaeota archaeon]
MKIEINIQKKQFFFLMGFVVLLAGGVFVVAYGGGPPNVMGHSFGELEGATPNCQQFPTIGCGSAP